MSTSGSKSNEHVAHFLVDIHIQVRYAVTIAAWNLYCSCDMGDS